MLLKYYFNTRMFLERQTRLLGFQSGHSENHNEPSVSGKAREVLFALLRLLELCHIEDITATITIPNNPKIVHVPPANFPIVYSRKSLHPQLSGYKYHLPAGIKFNPLGL